MAIYFKKYGGDKLYKSGFTLLEMIVSLGIFSVIAVIAVGSLVRITSLNRQAQAMQSTMNSVNYILESISREMRFGGKFHCLNGNTYNGNPLGQQNCNGNGDPANFNSKAILFESSKTSTVGPGQPCKLVYAYWFEPTSPGGNKRWDIKKSYQTSCGQSLTMADAISLVDNKAVTLTSVYFDIVKGPRNYSWTLISLTGYAGDKEKEKNNFSIATGISQRIMDI